MKKRWICSGIMIAISLAILVGMFFSYIKVDFHGFGDKFVELAPELLGSDILKELAQGIRAAAEELLKQLISAAGSSSSDPLVLSFTGFGIISQASSWSSRLKEYEAVAAALKWTILIVLIPCVFSILAFAFSFVRRRWSYLTAGICSLLGLAGTLISVLFIFPNRIYNAILGIDLGEVSSLIGKSLTDTNWVSAIAGFVGGGVDTVVGGTVAQFAEKMNFHESTVRGFIVRGLGPAYWISIVCFVILLVLSVVGFIIARKPSVAADGRGGRDRRPPVGSEGDNTPIRIPPGGFNKTYAVHGKAVRTAAQPGIQCSFGPLAGVTIPLAAGDRLTLGTDADRCNLVCAAPGVAPVHCSILWNQGTGEYTVLDPAGAGVYLDGRRITPGRGIPVPGGARVFLGNEKNSVRLL